MPLNFPNNPANGDVYQYDYTIDLNGTTFFRNVDYTYSSAKDSWTGELTISQRIADPNPSDVTASPPFTNAGETDAGTEQNPYRLLPNTNPTPGSAIESTQLITFTGQVSGERILFQDFSGTSSTRFQQFLTFCDGYGTATTSMRYEDDPTTPPEQDGIVYTALLKSGNTWFTWDVTQQVAQPIVEDTPSTIVVTGNTYTVGQTVTMTPGTITSGTAPYSYTYKWQRSVDGSVWTDATTDSSDTAVLNYVLTEADQGYFLRGVTTGTDSTTPVNQFLAMNSNNSPVPVKGPPRLSEVRLVRSTQSDVNRFSGQTYTSFISLSNQGTDGNTKSIKATFSLPNGTLRYATMNAAGEVTDIQSLEPGFTVTTQQGNIAIKFPVSFSTGSSPDLDLPEGTSMITTVRASNAFGNSDLNSNSILPELGDVVAFPTPDFIGTELTQNADPFIPSETPFNSGVGPLGSNKAQYGFAWNASPTTITFDPPWNVSATPITQFQGGGAIAGLSDFIIIFTNSGDVDTQVVIDTKNADWSEPIKFSDYGFTPPTNIKRIVLQSLQLADKQNGLVGFYAADDSPVIYETLAASQTRLTTKKTNILNSLS